MSLSSGKDPQVADKAAKTWLSRQVASARMPLGLAMGASMLDGALLITQSWLLAWIIARVVVTGYDLGDVGAALGALLAVFIARALLSPWIGIWAFEAAARVKHAARLRLYEHLQHLGPVWMARQRSGHIAHTLSESIEALDNYYAGYLPQMVRAAFLPLAILIIVFPSDWISGVILLITAPLIPGFMILIGKGTEKFNQRQWRRLARLSAHFFDAIQGLTTLKLFGASRREASLVGKIAEAYRHSTMAVLRIAFLSSLMLEFLATIAIAMVAVYIGFRLYYGQMEFLPGLFVLVLAPEFFLPLRNMGTQYHARMEAIGAAEQIVALFDQPLPETAPARTGAKLPTRLEQIQFARVGFAYDAGTPVLADVSFTMQRGQRLALVGISGAGKSTISRLLLGILRPQSGAILVDGQPLAEIDEQAWLRRVAWLDQNPTLFHGTIADNIRLGHREAGDEQVRQAARQANAAAFIEHLPQGYDTSVGDQGQGLSGGQIQRIALARAFLKQADVVVLDEASASLDPDAEQLVVQAIERLAEERLVLVIAHRLATVQQADHVVVLQQGRIVEQGSHAELLQRQGQYARMLAMYAGQEV